MSGLIGFERASIKARLVGVSRMVNLRWNGHSVVFNLMLIYEMRKQVRNVQNLQ